MINKKDVHTEHCCILHGCKYGSDECTVVNKMQQQSYLCEMCNNRGIENIPDEKNPDYGILLLGEQELLAKSIRMYGLLREVNNLLNMITKDTPKSDIHQRINSELEKDVFHG
jgi:hypothetical protein